ncbi:uncharacterized protein LOC142572699 isoform X3 [Dermacentor variabilis]|uniref:uncharacterized protein LOC142572699 isoform X3 n=1 Tax=Dermacentor variabilis TaxID=34621 RepID=UPI003F5B8732
MYEPVVPEHASIPLNVPLSVSMVNFESPTRFWLRLACSKAPFIKHFVRGCERHLYSAEIGQYCVADTRHTVVDLARAFVTDVFRNTAGVHVSAEVQCVDYGLTLVLGLDRLFPLSVEDARTPCVAILCRLHRVATCTRQPPQWRLPANSELEAVFVGVSDTVSFTDSAYSLCGEWEWGSQPVLTLDNLSFLSFLPFCLSLSSLSSIQEYKRLHGRHKTNGVPIVNSAHLEVGTRPSHSLRGPRSAPYATQVP